MESFIKTILKKCIAFVKTNLISLKESAFYAKSAKYYPFVKSYLMVPVLFVALMVFLVPKTTTIFISNKLKYYSPQNPEDLKKTGLLVRKLQWEINSLDNKLKQKVPFTGYMVINSSKNEFNLYKNRKLVRNGRCSTGSYILLKNGDHQQWIFKTPKGEFRVHGKTTYPVWIKPDWAFVEEGLPIPPPYHHSRYEYGVLGDYALSLGQGYLIHGTLYQRFLGLPVTHGCIRLNDADLELVYLTLDTGSKVYIF